MKDYRAIGRRPPYIYKKSIIYTTSWICIINTFEKLTFITQLPSKWLWYPIHHIVKRKWKSVLDWQFLQAESTIFQTSGSESLFWNCWNCSHQMGGADRIKMSEKWQAIYRIYSCSLCNMTFPSLDKFYVYQEIKQYPDKKLVIRIWFKFKQFLMLKMHLSDYS